MRAFAVLSGATLSASVLAACNGGATEPPFLTEESPAPTAEMTASITATAAPDIASYDDPFDFRSFAAQLDDAIGTADVQFFLDNVMFEDLECAAEFPAPPESCADFLDPRCDKSDPAYVEDPEFAARCPIYQLPGTSMPGIVVGVWQSEGFGLDAARYDEFIHDFLTDFDAGASDIYAGAEPQLYAYGIFRPEFQRPNAAETVEAIATRIVPGPEPRFPPPGRSVLIFDVSFDGQRWSITGMSVAGDPFTLAQSLDPTSPVAIQAGGDGLFEVWTRWERWEGTP